MESITRFITHNLKLKVNETKSAVARPQERKFLGFSFTAGPEVKRVIAPKALDRFKRRIREITRRAKGVSIQKTIEELASYMRGWRSYFGFCETPEVRSLSPVGSGCGFGPLCGGSGKHHAVDGPLCWHWGFGRVWPATRPAAVVALGSSRRARPFLWGFLMPTSNRSDFQR
jgi:hypothetical protein